MLRSAGVIGEVIGKYRITRKLGKGGMGVVYVGEHVMIGSPAVVKVLKTEVSEDRVTVERFFNEARAAAQIQHPAIVQVFDSGVHEASGSAFIVMELLGGESLSDRIKRGPMPAAIAVAIARQIASALSAAHRAGIIHRDLKPDNLFLVPDPELREGRVKVLDFGIAKLAMSNTAITTKTGDVFGTPAYMSPEQCHNASQVDERTDIYSLGCILHEMLTGKRLFGRGSVVETIAAHLLEDPAPPSEIVRGVPPALDRIVLRMLSKQAAQRYATMAELERELHAIDDPLHAVPAASTIDLSPPRTKRWKRFAIIAASGVVAGGIAIAVILATGDHDSHAPAAAPRDAQAAVHLAATVPVADAPAAPLADAPPADAAAAEDAEPAGMGSATISAAVPCAIYVDGTATGKMTPQTNMPLALGHHVIRVVASDGTVDRSFELDVRPGDVNDVTVQ